MSDPAHSDHPYDSDLDHNAAEAGGDSAIHFITKTGRRLRLQYGPYRVRQVIGEGGMGAIVLEAEDLENHRDVAIKVFSPDRRMTHEMRRRFIRGARASAGIDHPNVVKIFSTGEEAGRPYFAMELVRGKTLDQLIRDEGRVAPHRAVEVCLQAARGLSAAAEQGVIHRDVKPQNILVPDDGGQVKISDFGIASIEQQESIFLQPGIIVGTPYYMSPEMCQAEAVDHRSDIYSLGITFYETLCGKPPFSGTPVDVMYKQSHKRPRPIARRVPTLHPRVARVIKKMLAKKPAKRFQDYGSLIQALEEIQKLSLFVVRSRRRPGVVSAIGIGIAVGLLGALWYSGLWKPPETKEARKPEPPGTVATEKIGARRAVELRNGGFEIEAAPSLEEPAGGGWRVLATQMAAEHPETVVAASFDAVEHVEGERSLRLAIVDGATLEAVDVIYATPWGLSARIPDPGALEGHTLELHFQLKGQASPLPVPEGGRVPPGPPVVVVRLADSARELAATPAETIASTTSWREVALTFDIPVVKPVAKEKVEERILSLRLFLAGDGGDILWLDDVRLAAIKKTSK